MKILAAFVAALISGALLALIGSLIDGYIAYLCLDSTFHLGFKVWWGIAFVAIQIVSTGATSLRNSS